MKIEWTEPAVLDLQSIQKYIGKDSELYASLFVEKVLEAVDKLFERRSMKSVEKACLKRKMDHERNGPSKEGLFLIRDFQ